MSQYYVPDSEDYLECPYDKTHMVRAKRFQYHLMKCRHNYKGKDYVNCRFNAKHEMPRPELRHHEASCPDRARLEIDFRHEARKQEGDDSTLKGYTEVPTHSDMVVPETENWDDEADGPVRVGVDPSHYSRVRFMNIGGMSTGEKKQMRKDGNLPNEEKIKNMLENIQIDRQENPQDEEGALRLPKTTSFAAMANRPELRPREQPMSSVFAYTIGRGRARGRGLRSSNAGPVNGEQVKVHQETEPINTEKGLTNGASETPTQIYERVPQRCPGRGRGLAVGLGRGRAPMGMGFVPPPPGFLGAGRAGPLGVADSAFPQFIVPKVGNHSDTSPYVGEDPWSDN